MNPARPVVAAVMIVKNEHHVVLDALRSVQPVADHWVVLDTGSTDGTQALLTQYADEHPGHLHEGPFVDFSDARNRLLALAEPTCDWMVILDADMAWDQADVLRGEIEAAHADPTVDGLAVEVGDAETYRQVRVFRTGRGWRYRYRTHELAVMPGTPVLRHSTTTALHFATGGSRGDKLERDLVLLGLDLADDPHDPLTHYYLGGTCRGLGELRRSISEFRKAIALDPVPDSELVYISHFQIAAALADLQMPAAAIEDALLQACTTRPGRHEARALLYRRLVESRRFEAVVGLEEMLAAEPAHASEYMFVRREARPTSRFELARALFALGLHEPYAAVRAELLSDHETPVELRETVLAWPR